MSAADVQDVKTSDSSKREAAAAQTSTKNQPDNADKPSSRESEVEVTQTAVRANPVAKVNPTANQNDAAHASGSESEGFFGKMKDEILEKMNVGKEWMCETIVDYPLRHCGCYWASLMLMLIIVLAGGFMELNQIALVDFQIGSKKDVQNDFALDRARELTKEGGGLFTTVKFRAESLITFSFFFLYELDDNEESLFTRRNVQLICQAESTVLGSELYKSFCVTEDPQGKDTVCTPPFSSMTNIFYGGFGAQPVNTNCPELDDTQLNNILNQFQNNPALAQLRLSLVDNPDDIRQSKVARSIINLAGPLGEDSPPFGEFTETASLFLEDQAENGYAKMMEAFKDSIIGFAGVEDKLFNQGFARKHFATDSDLLVRVHGFHLEFLEFMTVVTVDSMISGGSFIVVTALVYLYTKSCFFSLLSMFAVALSVIFGLFLYAVVFQIDYFTNLHVVVLFIVLAIGANNIFVMVDAWRQSEAVILEELEKEQHEQQRLDESKGKNKNGKNENRGSSYNPMFDNQSEGNDSAAYSEREILIRRMKYAYARAAKSVANTALTTAIAFVATVTSPLAPIAAFGLFGGIVIFVNWIYMLNVHPATLMVYHKYIVMPKLKKQEDSKVIKRTEKGKFMQLVDTMFKHYLFLMNNTIFPKVSLAITVVYGITMTAFAFQLETPTSVESNFKDDHMFTGFTDAFNEPFAAGNDETFSLCTAAFGISGINQDGVKRFSIDPFRGETIFDDDFDITLEETQEFIIDFCETIPTVECFEEGCTTDKIMLDDTLVCWLPAFRTWANETLDLEETFIGGAEDLTPETVIQMIIDFAKDEGEFGGFSFQRHLGFINGEFKFTTVAFRKSMKEDQPLKIKQPVLKVLTDVQNDFRDEAPAGLKSFFLTSFDFVWQHTEEGLVSGLYSGMAVSLFASWLVVLGGTQNLKVSLFAIGGVGAIVFCVLGTVQRMGWELGTAEALAGVMVIGLAVDYTVHLGYMFVQSQTFLKSHSINDLGNEDEVLDRSRRILTKASRISDVEQAPEKKEENVVYNADMVTYAVDRMGVTILAGAVTTLCSGVFLLLCTLAFFSKMAILIIFTVIYSTIFAFAFFVPMLRVFGPGVKDKITNTHNPDAPGVTV